MCHAWRAAHPEAYANTLNVGEIALNKVAYVGTSPHGRDAAQFGTSCLTVVYELSKEPV